jgi:hypothetical protein
LQQVEVLPKTIEILLEHPIKLEFTIDFNGTLIKKNGKSKQLKAA